MGTQQDYTVRAHHSGMNQSFEPYLPTNRELARINYYNARQLAKSWESARATDVDRADLISDWLYVRECADDINRF